MQSVYLLGQASPRYRVAACPTSQNVCQNVMQFYHQQNAINFQVVTPNQARHQLGEPTVYNYNNVVLYTQQGNGLRDVRWRRTHESSKHGQIDSIVEDARHEYSGYCGCCSVICAYNRYQNSTSSTSSGIAQWDQLSQHPSQSR